MLELPSVEHMRSVLAGRGVTLPPGAVRVDGYGDSPEQSERLLALILAGKKRAGTGLLWAYEHDGDPLPAPGQIEVVVDHQNDPVLVARLTEVSIVPFCEVSAEYAAVEGEGDGSLAYWQAAHWDYFGRECARIGREPARTMPVVCSVFVVLSVVPAASADDREDDHANPDR